MFSGGRNLCLFDDQNPNPFPVISDQRVATASTQTQSLRSLSV